MMSPQFLTISSLLPGLVQSICFVLNGILLYRIGTQKYNTWARNRKIREWERKKRELRERKMQECQQLREAMEKREVVNELVRLNWQVRTVRVDGADVCREVVDAVGNLVHEIERLNWQIWQVRQDGAEVWGEMQGQGHMEDPDGENVSDVTEV